MTSDSRQGSALHGLRVLDLSGEAGALCGRLLADLGADVILIEPPDGHPQRHRPPYLKDEPGIERSLAFMQFHTGQRGVTLNLEEPGDRDRFAWLAGTADFVLDGHAPGYLDSLGIGYRQCGAANPRLIWVAITPYGSDGPLAGWIGTDLTLAAAGGFMKSMGWEEDPPFRCGGDQAYLSASQQATLGALSALYQRGRTGEGQFVDVSIEECVAAICNQLAVGAAVDGSDQGHRPTPGGWLPPGDGPYKCKDGIVVAGGGPVAARHWPEFIDWMGSEGYAKSWQGDSRWADLTFRYAHREEVEATVREFYSQHTMAELCDGSIPRGFMLFPIHDFEALLKDPQLRARDFFSVVSDPGRGLALEYPGVPIRLEGTPAKIYGPAPLLGEHNVEVFAGYQPTAAPVGTKVASTGAAPDFPLRGLRAVALTWHIAGPLVGRWLADQGAEVLKIETRHRPDPGRASGPFPPEVPPERRSANMAGWFNSFNCGVHDVTLDLTKTKGVELLRELVAKSDILVENFAPGTLDKWGLNYEGAKALKQDIIMISMPLVGSVGPRAGLSGGGNHITGLSGLSYICGVEGGEPAPVGPRGVYPDYGPNPLYGSIALMAALYHRQQTGEGQHIEIAQFESLATMTGTALLEYAANGTNQTRMGNRSRHAAPHNAYRCLAGGRERWCAIAVETDGQWRALSRVVGDERLTLDPRFATLAGRKAAEDEIDRIVESWTSKRTVEDVVETLQAVGVPSAPVNDGFDMLRDPQLLYREHFRSLPHPEVGDILPIFRLGFRLEKGLLGPTAPSPLLGQHTNDVLSDVLGLPDADLRELGAAGVLT